MTLASPLGSEPVKRKTSKVDVVGLIPDTAAVSRCGAGMGPVQVCGRNGPVQVRGGNGRPSCELWTQNQSELLGLPLNVPSLPSGQALHWGPSRARACTCTPP